MRYQQLDDYIIYLYGVDGAGKTTIAKELVKVLRARGMKASYLWMRFPHFFTKGINALGRLTGLSYYTKTPKGDKIGYHHYSRPVLLRIAYCLTTILDVILFTWVKLRIPRWINKKVIILDRYVFDIMVDVSIDVDEANLIFQWPGIFLKKILNKDIIPIYIHTDKEIILQHRSSVTFDKFFDLKMTYYQKLYQTYGTYKVHNNSTIEKAIDTILSLISNEKEKHSTSFRA